MVCLVKCGLCGGNCTIFIHQKSHPPKHIFNTHVKEIIIIQPKMIKLGIFKNKSKYGHSKCRNPTLAKCGGEAQHLEKVRIWSPPGLPNI
jgi:hypothetical protein